MNHTIKFLDGTEKTFETLRDANLPRANLRDADLSGADLSGANLSGARNLESAVGLPAVSASHS